MKKTIFVIIVLVLFLMASVASAEYCFKWDEYCDVLHMTYDVSLGLLIGYSDGCGQITPWPVYAKIVPGDGWRMYEDWAAQGWPPDCSVGDFCFDVGHGSVVTSTCFIGCTEYVEALNLQVVSCTDETDSSQPSRK